MLFVNRETRDLRLATCGACEHYVETTRSCGPLVTEAFTDSKLCGCYMPAKTKLKVASCPLGKWEPTISRDEIEAIRHMLDNTEQYTNEDLTQWHNKLTGGRKNRTSCTPCNNKMFKELRNFIKNADKEQ